MTMSFETKEIIKCRGDFAYFSKTYLKVLHPERGLVPFELHPFQENRVLPAFQNEKFLILRKFRQAGLSTLAAMYSLWQVLFFTDVRVLMISITDRDSKNLMSMVKRAWEYLPDWIQCETIEFSQHNIKLETGSEVRCGTPKMGRGYSANLIVIDEAAFIPNMEEVWKGIFPALASAGDKGKAFIISTVNGLGNWYADVYHDAKDEKNDFKCLDLHYMEHPEYRKPEFVERMKAQLGPRGWDQEVLGIFLSGSDTFVRPEIIQRLKDKIEKDPFEPKKMHNDKLWIWKKPRNQRSYILSADVAEGLGGEHDYSAFHVLDLITLEQVCEFCSNEVSTYEYARILNEMGKYYNDAILVVENNSLGVGVLERLYNDLDYENIHWSRTSKRNIKMGFTMTNKSRPLVLNTFSNLIEEGHVKIRSSRVLHEIQTFEFNKRSRKAEARPGRHDDLIMAMAIGLFTRNTIINTLPIGVGDDYGLEDPEFEPTFDPKYEQILKMQNGNNKDGGETIDQYFSDKSDAIEIVDAYEDEEDLLKEFGW